MPARIVVQPGMVRDSPRFLSRRQSVPPDAPALQQDRWRGGGVAGYGDNGGQQLQFDDAGNPVVVGLNEQGGVGWKAGIRPDMGVKLSHFWDWIESVVSTK